MTTDTRFATVARMVLAGQLVTLWLVSSALAVPQQETARPIGGGDIAPDCRASAAQFERSRGAPQWLDQSERTDTDTWETLAAARFMAGDVRGALDAWNRVGQPRVRCLNVEGAVRTPRSTVISYLGPWSGEILTAESFGRMERRLDELPVASRTRLRYDPVAGGVATVTPIVAERSMIPEGLQSWGVVGVRSAFLQEIRVDVSGAAGRGEVLSPSYRWAPNRPRAMVRLDAPAPGLLPGIVRFQTFVESQTYRYATLGDETFRQSRQRVSVAMSDWITSWLRWEGGTAFDRIETSPFLALEGSLNARALDDKVAVILTAGRWLSDGESPSFTNAELAVAMRSTTREDMPVLTSLVGVASAADSAPLALWPAVSSGDGRNSLLRAHPLRRGSIVTGEVFGRHLVFSSTEFEYPLQTRVGPVGVAGFIDTARASRRLDFTSSPFHVDVGTGVRFSASGTGKVRLDVGYGIRDGHFRLSAGYAVPWGRR